MRLIAEIFRMLFAAIVAAAATFLICWDLPASTIEVTILFVCIFNGITESMQR